MIHLSVIIPAYNEEKRIAGTLDKVYNFLATKNYDFEVIVVDDGSTDGTVKAANESRLAGDRKLKVLKNYKNAGKGSAVKNGIADSKGEYILFSDADSSTPIEEVDRLFGSIDEGYDIVIGSRALEESEVKIRQAWYREIMGRVFNFFVKSILIKEFDDTQCGFKLFKGSAARDIAGCMGIKGFCFDVEMLYLAKIKGYNIEERGVVWNNSPESKVRLFSSSVSMFLDLMRIKMIYGKKGQNN